MKKVEKVILPAHRHIDDLVPAIERRRAAGTIGGESMYLRGPPKKRVKFGCSGAICS